ncbi:hypothetical protein ACS0TY_005193 [Phlomoides rotata]
MSNVVSTASESPSSYNGAHSSRIAGLSSSSTSIQGTRQDRFMFPYPTQWGTPTFAVGHSIAMTSDVLLPMVEGPAIFRNGLYGAYLMAD